MFKKWFAALSRYPRLRILLVVAAVIVVVVVIGNLLSSGPKAPKDVPPPSQLVTPQVNPEQTRTVGTPVAATAANQNGNFFAGIFGNEAAQNKPAAAPKPAAQTPKPAAPAQPALPLYHGFGGNQPDNSQAQRMQMQPQQQEGLNEYQMRGAGQLSDSMRTYINSNRSSWALPTAQQVVGEAGSGSGAGGSGGSVLQRPVMIKAGSIQFAVLSVGLNSDQPNTPVLAEIVEGKFKGARLMGTFARANDKLVVQFNMMSMPKWPSTISITAYAIDADTGRNALASNVDNHYLLRYGSLFAASFLQGFGNAYSQASTTPGCTSLVPGGCVVTTGNTSPQMPAFRSSLYQGAGQIGTNLSAQVAQNYNMPPTVTLDQGTGMGILFMSDIPRPAFYH